MLQFSIRSVLCIVVLVKENKLNNLNLSRELLTDVTMRPSKYSFAPISTEEIG